jgi:hypothetical protein
VLPGSTASPCYSLMLHPSHEQAPTDHHVCKPVQRLRLLVRQPKRTECTLFLLRCARAACYVQTCSPCNAAISVILHFGRCPMSDPPSTHT